MLVLGTNAFPQVLVNRDWAFTSTNALLTTHTNTITRDNNGYLYAVLTTYATFQQENMRVFKFDPYGTLLWEYDYNSLSDDKDLVADITTIGTDIYITGISWDSTNAKSSFTTFKLNEDGALQWQANYADAYNGLNLATCLQQDSGKYIYVAGTVETGSNDYAYTLVKYDTAGNQLWAEKYDSAHAYDGVAAIERSGSDIVVTGVSGTPLTGWDFLTINYKPWGGAPSAVSRISSDTANITNPVDIAKDFDDNIYILGNHIATGGNQNMRLVKFDTAFNLQWVRTFDYMGLTDKASAMVYDFNGGIYITGYGTDSTGNTCMILVKYDEAGNLLWQRRRPAQSGYCRGKEVAVYGVSGDYKVYVSGTIEENGHKQIITQSYTPDGNIRWERQYHHTGTSNDEALDVEHYDDVITYVAGISRDTASGGDTTCVFMRYSEAEIMQEAVMDSDTVPIFLKGNIIIRFNPKFINTDFVNSKEREYVLMENLLPDSVIEKLSEKAGLDFSKMVAEKVYKRMTVADSISISRIGDTVVIDKIWSTVVVHMDDTVNIPLVVSAIDTLFEEVFYAEPNYLYAEQDIPDDPNFSIQNSLFPTNIDFDEADINIDPAWDIEKGNSAIKIGVYDSGIRYDHEDFSLDGSGTLQGSKIAGGWDFVSNHALIS